MSKPSKMTGDFSGKPKTTEFADKIASLVKALGPSKEEKKGQLTFAIKRKFLWMWVYSGTADGTLYLTLCLDRELKGAHFQYVKQISPKRWNHHVVVKSAAQIETAWFKDLLKAGYEFGGR